MFNEFGEREYLMNPNLVRKVWEQRRREAARRKREKETQQERERDERKRRAAEARQREMFLDTTDPLRPLRRAGFPAWAIEIVCRVAEKHCISPLRLVESTRRSIVVGARYEAVYEIKAAKPALSSVQIGRWFNRDHSSILYALAKHALANEVPPLSDYDAIGKLSRMKSWRERAKPSPDGQRV